MPICEEAWGEVRTWACIAAFTTLGWDRGCAFGCASCRDETFLSPQRFAEGGGAAWTRPRNFYESRDARGVFLFPGKFSGGSNQANLDWFACRPRAEYEHAWCHSYQAGYGRQLFTTSLCDCHFVCAPPVALKFDDMEYCFPLLGEKFPPTDGPDIICAGANESEFVRMFQFIPQGHAPTTIRPPGPCSIDAAVRCWGQQSSAGCFPGAGNPPHYYAQPHNSAFDYMFVQSLGGRLVDHAEFDDAERSRVDAFNAVLDWLSADINLGAAGLTNLDQIDGGINQMFGQSRRNSQDGFLLNAQLSNWFRGFNLLWDANGVPVNDLPDLPPVLVGGQHVYNQSHLLNSRHDVVTELVVISGYLSMNMTLSGVADRPAGAYLLVPPSFWRVYPGIRLTLHLELTMRVAFPDGDPRELVQDWRDPADPFHTVILEVGNDGFQNNFLPTVGPAGPSGAPIDRIVYRDQAGRISEPPRFVDIDYHLGPMSLPAWTNVLDLNFDHNAICCQIAHGMDSVVVPALVSNLDRVGNEHQRLTGNARLGSLWDFSTC